MSYINIGKVTEEVNDLKTNVDNIKAHEVIEFQAPTADNNYTWYRLYADGWVEQGGQVNLPSVADGSGTSGNSNIALPVAMLDANYFVTINCGGGSSGWQYYNGIFVAGRTTTVLTVKLVSGASSGVAVYWRVEGMAA